MTRVLVFGYGNPGRRDDGLGPALAAAIESREIPGVVVESNYQLSVEDAALAAEYDTVVFADAAVAGPEPYEFRSIAPRADTSFTSHHVTAEAVLALAQDLFQKVPQAYMLSIRGYEFNEFHEALSQGAQANLEAAAAFLADHLRTLTV